MLNIDHVFEDVDGFAHLEVGAAPVFVFLEGGVGFEAGEEEFKIFIVLEAVDGVVFELGADPCPE